MEPDRALLGQLPVVIGSPGGIPGLPGRAEIREQLIRHGAVLLRGFAISGLPEFERIVRHLAGPPLNYSERSSPRTALHGNLYTSTDYPPEEEIFLHNENSYQASWPQTLFFCCLRAPDARGATPLADVRQVLALVDPAVRAEFSQRQWMVVRNFHDGFGPSWQYVFGTDDRDAVTSYCQEKGITAEWLPSGRLRTRAVRTAIHRHPRTAEEVWFNHATFFHHTMLPEEVREGLSALFDADDLPTDTRFGDGDQIPDDVVDHLRDCYRRASTRFDWHAGDVLMVDNMLVAHGREPFSGTRKIIVAMAEPHPPGAEPAG